MIDIEQQVDYWRDGAQEDWEVAQELVKNGRTRHGLFFAHLTLEKMLKAHVCRATESLAPKIHSLLRLAELAELSFSEMQQEHLARIDRYQLEGRYPDQLPVPLSVDKSKKELKVTEELLRWLINQF